MSIAAKINDGPMAVKCGRLAPAMGLPRVAAGMPPLRLPDVRHKGADVAVSTAQPAGLLGTDGGRRGCHAVLPFSSPKSSGKRRHS